MEDAPDHDDGPGGQRVAEVWVSERRLAGGPGPRWPPALATRDGRSQAVVLVEPGRDPGAGDGESRQENGADVIALAVQPDGSGAG